MTAAVELVVVDDTAFFCDRLSLQVFTMVGAIAAMQAVTISSTSGVGEGCTVSSEMSADMVAGMASLWTRHVSFFRF